MQTRARAVLDRIADQGELHGGAPRSIRRSKNRKKRVTAKSLSFDRLGEDRVEPAEFTAEHVGKELVADDGDLAPAQLQSTASRAGSRTATV